MEQLSHNFTLDTDGKPRADFMISLTAFQFKRSQAHSIKLEFTFLPVFLLSVGLGHYMNVSMFDFPHQFCGTNESQEMSEFNYQSGYIILQDNAKAQ